AICAVYMHAGGQTSIIMTDLAQSLILFVAGILIFVLGIAELGGFSNFLNSLEPSFRQPFTDLIEPARFSSVGIFWQDAFGSSIAFYFMNQGVLMRFMSVRSVADGKRAIFFVVLILMPLAAFAVSNAGWIGRSMVNTGLLSPESDPNQIFVTVTARLASPGIFGFIMAALTAALMSTVDTLVNAVTVIGVNDVVKKFSPERDDSYYLRWARIISFFSTFAGIILVPVFIRFKSIYVAHGAFTAAVTPPVVVAIIFAAFWKRYTAQGAFWTITGGGILVALSIWFPDLIRPFAHGIAPEGYEFMRALYGIVVCSVTGVVVSILTRPQDSQKIRGLVIDSIKDAKRIFKGGKEPNDSIKGERVSGRLYFEKTNFVHLSPAAMERLKAEAGDILYISDSRWWLGGLKSIHLTAGNPHSQDDDIIIISEENAGRGNLSGKRTVTVEKII
ncbi:MAG: sodium:solute symporter family protein, partial [Deltaproteobacteria bacterium]|nr:sodium:solute symporter family protein [Deltaproteobacteria bacterium]